MNWKLLAKSLGKAGCVALLVLFHLFMCDRMYDWFGYGAATGWNFGFLSFCGAVAFFYVSGNDWKI